jgi:ketosteroid isomerase-like protein
MTTEEQQQQDAIAIQGLLNDLITAFHDKHLDGVMAIYAPDIVSFDIGGPLQQVGADTMRKVWATALPLFQGPITYEMRDLDITVGDEVAFSHSLNHISGTLTTGQQLGRWVRWTACFRKINGTWQLVHDQVSVPVDLQTGKAALDLTP